MKVALYVRVSTEEQSKGHSLDSQRDILREWVGREGWEEAGLYEDAGISGTDAAKRPAFQRMVADAEAGAFDAVLVLRYDRFARSLKDSAVYRERLMQANVQLLSYQERTEDGPSGFLTRGMHELLAEYYSVELSHKTRLGMKKRTEKGMTLGPVPFGYRRVDGVLVPEPAEAEMVREMFAMYARGATLYDCHTALLAAGFQSPRGGEFEYSTVRNMLRNPVYIGSVVHNGEVVARSAHEAIVTPEMWAAVQRRRSVRGAPRRRKRDFLLSGVAKCSRCQRKIWAHTLKSRYFYYRCSGASVAECEARARSAPAAPIEEAVDRIVRRFQLPDGWREQAEQFRASTFHSKHRDVEAMKRKIPRLKQMVADELIEYDEGRRQIKALEAEIAAAEAPDSPLETAALQLRDLPVLWPDMTTTERRQALTLVMDSVEIDVINDDLAMWYPKPVFVPLLKAANGPLVYVPESVGGFTAADVYGEAAG